MFKKIIVDADMCIKLGSSERNRFLVEVLPLVSEKIYMHRHAFGEILAPQSVIDQLNELINRDIVEVVDESALSGNDRTAYQLTYNKLSNAMIDPDRPNKNKGEVSSLAYAKATGIPVFATDEGKLQSIVDKLLNTGIDDILCLRIIDIIGLIHNGEIELSRRYAKAMWRISSGREDANTVFDHEIWPQNESSPINICLAL